MFWLMLAIFLHSGHGYPNGVPNMIPNQVQQVPAATATPIKQIHLMPCNPGPC